MSDSDHESEPIHHGPQPDKINPVEEVLSSMSWWQAKRIAIMFFICLPGCAHVVAMIFATSTVDFWCQDSGKSNETLGVCIPNCSDYQFDQSVFSNTVASKFGLVCELNALETMTKLSLFCGYALGTFGAGIISDDFGRKQAILIFSQVLFGSGILVTVMPNVYAFAIVWFFVGVSSIAVYTVVFVWCSEIVGKEWKVLTNLIISCAFPFSKMLVTFAAYYIRDFEVLFQIFSAMHLITPILMLFIPESPRWLLSIRCKSRQTQASHVLAEVAKAKGRTFRPSSLREPGDTAPLGRDPNPDEVDHFSLVLTHPLLRMRCLIMLYCWFVVSFITYSVNINMALLTGSLFQNFIISTMLEIPGKLLTYFILTKLAMRKLPFTGFFFIGSLCLFISGFLDSEVVWQNYVLSALVLLASMILSITFTVAWIFTTEIYPTGIRNFGVGLSSFVARVGGTGSIFIVYLANLHPSAPFFSFAALGLLAGLLVFLLPETGGLPLPGSMKDIEQAEIDRRSR